MTITLRPELERFISQEVTAGRFTSTTEAVEAAVARLMLDPQFEAADESEVKELRASLDEMRHGKVLDWSEYSAQLRSKLTR